MQRQTLPPVEVERRVKAGKARRTSGLPYLWRQLQRRKLAMVGSVIVAVFVLVGLLAGAIAPHDYTKQDLMKTLLPPGSEGHLLGTDQHGRDLLSRLVHGIRVSLLVGFGVTALAMVIGIAVGISAGYYRGRIDAFLSSLMELAWGFPLILIAVILAGLMGPGLGAVMIAVILINWAGFARVVRGEVLGLRETEFIEAARALGMSDHKIMANHILPNVMAPTLVMGSYLVALAIIVEAGFSFIGLGAQPPLPSLGQMIAEGRNYMFVTHWVTTIPGLGIMVIVLGLNLLGDGLRDILDPRMRGA